MRLSCLTRLQTHIRKRTVSLLNGFWRTCLRHLQATGMKAKSCVPVILSTPCPWQTITSLICRFNKTEVCFGRNHRFLLYSVRTTMKLCGARILQFDLRRDGHLLNISQWRPGQLFCHQAFAFCRHCPIFRLTIRHVQHSDCWL